MIPVIVFVVCSAICFACGILCGISIINVRIINELEFMTQMIKDYRVDEKYKVGMMDTIDTIHKHCLKR